MRDLLSQLLHKTGYIESYSILSHHGKADLETICSHTKFLAGLTHWKEVVSFWFEVVRCPEINQEWD